MKIFPDSDIPKTFSPITRNIQSWEKPFPISRLFVWSNIRLPKLLIHVTMIFICITETTASCAEGELCAESSATICKNGTCVSVCATKGMRECVCDTEEDNYCYLCCGNEFSQCLPAHQHNILRSNGERWEREACARCRTNGAELEGLPCDDNDPARLCLGGKCSNSVCHTKLPGSHCDRKMEKICVEEQCENPCARIAPHLMVCDCASIDPDTGFASEDRCQLCCYDFNLKPANRRCQNAYRKYKVATSQNRPIWRVGLDCAGGKTCNRYGVCLSCSQHVAVLLLLLPILTLLLR